MSADDRVVSTAERCTVHPADPAVARCAGCGRAMCLACAVPVRGDAYGTECLHRVLGEDLPEATQLERRASRPSLLVAFALAVATTALPWMTFGEGASLFGAWGRSPRWSMLSAIAAVIGLATAWVANRRPDPGPRLDAAAAVLGALVAIGAVLEWFRPPFPSRPSVVPWIAAAAGGYAAVSAFRSLRRDLGA